MKKIVMVFMFLSVSLSTYSQHTVTVDVDEYVDVQAGFSFSPYQETSTGENAKLLAFDARGSLVWNAFGLIGGLEIRSYEAGDGYMLSKARRWRGEINGGLTLGYYSAENFRFFLYSTVGLWYAGVVSHKPKFDPTFSFGIEMSIWRVSLGAAWKSKRKIYSSNWQSNSSTANASSVLVKPSFEVRIGFSIFKSSDSDSFEYDPR